MRFLALLTLAVFVAAGALVPMAEALAAPADHLVGGEQLDPNLTVLVVIGAYVVLWGLFALAIKLKQRISP